MSGLTKVFVVIVALLSVMLVSLLVPFVANTQNYKDQADAARQEATLARDAAALLQTQIRALRDGETEKAANLNNEVTDLKNDFQVIQQQLAEKDAEVIRMRAQVGALEADRARLAASNQQLAQILAKQDEELESRREQMVSMRSNLIDSETRITELEAQLGTAERAVRRVNEQLARLQEEKGSLESMWTRVPEDVRRSLSQAASGSAGGATGAGDSSASVEYWPTDLDRPLTGRISQVHQEAGDTFVQVDVGQADGVEENMLMLVHRGDDYLGTLVITNVDERQAAGRMKLVKGGVEIAVGDAVLTGGT